MDIIVTGRNIEITDAIREYAQSKVGKLPRYFDRVQLIEVIVEKSPRQKYEVQLVIQVEHHDPFVGRESEGDLYACIDRVCDKMVRQLTDFKKRIRNRKHPVS